ncbi:DMT family transporter [Hydrogenimonas urashimensis]|uniref:DMT family transporter n=1 Tax=Hydrogenimonas urashimensis TaxID=2740515 RepID=UPI0019160429|nr:DMT family transporter [Hydrogenimonas urashimensis]
MTKEQQGELYALLLSILESWFPILTIWAIAYVGAIHTYAYAIVVAILFFLVLSHRRKTLGRLLDKKARRDLLLTGLFITLLFLFVYIGLRYTTAGNMSLIIFLQLFFAYLYFNVFGKEKMVPVHTLGAFSMGIGALIVLFPEKFGGFNLGDGLILLAAAIAPIANYYQQRARLRVPSETVLLFRYLFALPLLFLFAHLFEPEPTISQIRSALPWIVLSGLLVMGVAKILWVEALHRISITKLSAMTALIPLFTLVFAYLFLGEVPTCRQLLGVPFILLGGILITRPLRRLSR